MLTLSCNVLFSWADSPYNAIFNFLFTSFYCTHFTETNVEDANLKLRSIRKQRGREFSRRVVERDSHTEIEDILFSGWRTSLCRKIPRYRQLVLPIGKTWNWRSWNGREVQWSFNFLVNINCIIYKDGLMILRVVTLFWWTAIGRAAWAVCSANLKF